MANRLKGEVTVEADGTTYTLVYSVNALCELEDKLGESVADIGSLAAKGKRFSTIRTVFWAGLQDHHPDVDLKEAGRIITAMGIEKADAAVAEAFGLAFPEVKAVPLPLEVKPAPVQRARTGSRS
jgi:hypothetical protein